MKHIILALCATGLLGTMSTQAFSQSRTGGQRMMQRKDERHGSRRNIQSCPRVYIGFSTGINNPVGFLGPQIDVAITQQVSVGTGIGLSTWGTKTFLEGRYYFKPCNRGWAIATGLTYNSGSTKFTYRSDNTVAGTADVTLDLKPQTNIMVSGYHFFSLGAARRNRFHLQFGFSVPISGKGDFLQTAGPALTSKGQDEPPIFAPGGLIIGLGFSFGAGQI